MEQPTQRAAAPAKKRIAVFLDGTWNAVGTNTNVWRLKALLSERSDDGLQQLAYYDIGVNGFRGGVFGKGMVQNVNDAYSWLIDNYNPGDDIYVFGFSRGAYTARSLAGLIAKYGILKAGAPLGVNQVVDRYRRADRTLWKMIEDQAKGEQLTLTLEERWLLKYSFSVHIKLVAVWDTVGALGVPAFSIEGISRSTFNWLETGMRLSIDNAFHALAVDEHRAAFPPTLWTKRLPKDPAKRVAPPRPLTSVEQRWFVGAHANVGGGCQSDVLAQLPLKWIMDKAKSHGLAFKYEVGSDQEALAAPISDSYKEFLRGVYSRLSRRYYRTIGEAPRNQPDGTHININETIDVSVFDRWRHDANYRPPNLVEWAHRYKQEPAQLTSSVLADNPTVAA